MSKDIYLVTFVLRGKNRVSITNALAKGKKTQAELHKATGMYRTHVRRSLNELMEKRLVICLNPNDRIYKLYELSTLGKKVVKKANQIR